MSIKWENKPIDHISHLEHYAARKYSSEKQINHDKQNKIPWYQWGTLPRVCMGCEQLDDSLA